MTSHDLGRPCWTVWILHDCHFSLTEFSDFFPNVFKRNFIYNSSMRNRLVWNCSWDEGRPPYLFMEPLGTWGIVHLKAFGLPRFSRAFGQAQGGSGWRRFAFRETAPQAKSVYNCCVYSVKIWELLYCWIISIFGDYKFMCRFSCEPNFHL